ncbi:MAG: flagellar basal body rod protein FlgC [Calditrichaeota bacterium]|nr:flagellar basal body rod protein FlgC [Calditrichota bacterium]
MKIAPLFASIDISASGMSAQRRKLNAIASNIANVETTRTENGQPYQRKIVVTKEAKESLPFSDVLAVRDDRLVTTNPLHINTVLDPVNNTDPASGVASEQTVQKKNPYRLVYDPDHPDADASGYVRYPNINIVVEMVDMITASRAYEANAMAIESAKTMAKKALEI